MYCIRLHKKAALKVCKISEKIEFSHHIFVMAFSIRRKQRKAPHKAGRGETILGYCSLYQATRQNEYLD